MRYNIKRTLAGILTAAIISCFITTDSKAVTGNTGGTGSMEGGLSDVFNVVVPTQPSMSVDQGNLYNNKLDFILDPNQIAGAEEGILKDKFLEPDATVYFKNEEDGADYDYSSTSDGFTIINRSTAAVDVTLDASLTGMDGIKLTSDRTFANDKSASVFFALKDDKGKTAPIDKFGAIIKTTLDGQPDAYVVEYDRATDKYKYVMKSDQALKDNNITFSDYTFRLTGACNSTNSWVKLTGYLEPEVTVTWCVALRPKNVAPSIPKTSYVMNMGIPVSIDVDLGSGTLEATNIKSITYTNSSGAVSTLAPTNYTFVDGTLKFKSNYISSLIEEGIQSRSYKVVFNNNKSTQGTITLVTNDMAPSIAQTEYKMADGQPIAVDVDLGSGTLGATGIQSITFVSISGSTKTLPTTNYTFTDGVLKFSSAYVDSLLGNGVASREHTIVFNDKAGTREKVTFSIDGDAPSIAKKEYIIERDTEVAVEINKGSGSLEAKGIKEITFVNASNTKRTLSTEYYSYADGTLTFTASYINTLLNNGTASRAYTIVFDNVVGTQEIVTLAAEDVKPSIAQTEYKMVSGQPIMVDVDLGSGTLGATGIQSITFVSISGSTKTLPTSNYTFTNGVLKFSGTYIDSLLGNGVASREHTIVFNDKAGTREKVTFSIDGDAPSIAKKEYIIERDTEVAVEINKGSGSLEAKGIKEITFVNASNTKRTLSTEYYSYADGRLTFTASYINTLLNNGTASRAYTIVFDNAVGTQEIVTLAAEDVKPSIPQTEYKMVSGQPIMVDVDLGSGVVGATGIQSITFVSISGNTKTLPTTNYTFTDGVLKFSSAYIDSLLSNGVVSREHTIVFNDKAGTQEKVTFSIDGDAPSIAKKEYTIKRNAAVPIEINKGSGDLEVKGIKEITFVNASNTKRTLTTEYYSYADGRLTFTASYINTLLNNGTVSRAYTIIFDNVVRTQEIVTLAAEDVKPSIIQTEYKMVSGQPVTVDVDLGSGTLGATGIQSITYVKSGKTITVPTSYYTFTGGTLKFTTTYINGLVTGGIKTRDYKIILNDKAQTQLTITLKQ